MRFLKIIVLISALSPSVLQAQNNDATSALPAIIYLLQSNKDKVVDVALGELHSCALLESGSIKCWGFNGFGQLGNNSTISSLQPVKVSNIDNATRIAAGPFHTCAIIVGGAIKCWGSGSAGKLGYGSNNNSLVPVTVIGIQNAVRISLGGNHSCARVSGGLLTGPVKCWGSNAAGQLGDGTTTDSTIPVNVLNLSNALSISLGFSHSCARIGASLGGGTIQCWGFNSSGQLGNGSTDNTLVPVSVSGISNAIDLGMTNNHSCAVLADKTAVCWGANNEGELGNGNQTNSSVPVTVLSLRGFGKISVGLNHTCARTQDNSSDAILCWGDNMFGALGDGTNNSSNLGVIVTNINATSATIASGTAHNCALQIDNSVKCWGYNSSGQLGNGTTTNSPVPVNVLGL